MLASEKDDTGKIRRAVAADMATRLSRIREAVTDLRINPVCNNAEERIAMIQRESADLVEVAKQFPAPTAP
jgi:hypothetical protein